MFAIKRDPLIKRGSLLADQSLGLGSRLADLLLELSDFILSVLERTITKINAIVRDQYPGDDPGHPDDARDKIRTLSRDELYSPLEFPEAWIDIRDPESLSLHRFEVCPIIEDSRQETSSEERRDRVPPKKRRIPERHRPSEKISGLSSGDDRKDEDLDLCRFIIL